MRGYWLIVRSDKKVIVVDDPERTYSIGRNSELPAAQQLHHKYISHEHLRLRYAPPSLLVFQIGKNPTFYGSQCHRVPGKSDSVNGKVKPNAVEHDKEEYNPSHIATSASVASNCSNLSHNINDKDFDITFNDQHDYSKALVFCVSAHCEDRSNGSVVYKEEIEHIHAQTTTNNGIITESNNYNSANDDNIVYVDATQSESAHNVPEREWIDKSTLYFPDELHLPTLTVRYIQSSEDSATNKQNSHITITSTEAKSNTDMIEPKVNTVHQNNVTTVNDKSAPTLAQMLAVPMLKDEQEEEEEEEEEELEDVNKNKKILLAGMAKNENSSVQNTSLLSEKQKNDNNNNNDNNVLADGGSRAHEYRKEWQGLLNDAMKEEQQRLAEMKEQEEKNESEEQEELTGNNDISHVRSSKVKPATADFSDHKYNVSTTPCEASIPFGSSSSKYKNVQQKQSDVPQSTSTRKRTRPSTTRRGHSPSSSSSESSATLSEESSSESESSFTSTSSSSSYDDDESSANSSFSSSSSSTSNE